MVALKAWWINSRRKYKESIKESIKNDTDPGHIGFRVVFDEMVCFADPRESLGERIPPPLFSQVSSWVRIPMISFSPLDSVMSAALNVTGTGFNSMIRW